jgi:hypothetical protein
MTAHYLRNCVREYEDIVAAWEHLIATDGYNTDSAAQRALENCKVILSDFRRELAMLDPKFMESMSADEQAAAVEKQF